MNRTLDEMARAIFKSWFVDFDPVTTKAEGRRPFRMDAETAGLFPCDFVVTDWGLTPKGWNLGKFADLSQVTSGKRPGERSSVKTTDFQIPLFGGGGVMGFVKVPLYTQKTIITGRVGTIGQVFRSYKACWPSDNTLVILPINIDFFDFVYFQLLDLDFDSIIRGSTQPLITQGDVNSQEIVIPPPEIILAFQKFTAPVIKMIETNHNENDTLAALRDTLLPRLLSGELTVRAAEKVVGERT